MRSSPVSRPARVVFESIAMPQFSRVPPEWLADPVAPLVRVVDSADTLIRDTSGLFATQTDAPAVSFDEHELTACSIITVALVCLDAL